MSLTLISPEKIKIGIWYSFTLNLDISDIKYQPFSDTYQKYITKLQKIITDNVVFYAYPEISPRGKLHIHGFISFRTQLSISQFYYNIYFHTMVLEIDSISPIDLENNDNQKNYYNYVIKNNLNMMPLCDLYNMPYELNNQSISKKEKKTIEKYFYGDKRIRN